MKIYCFCVFAFYCAEIAYLWQNRRVIRLRLRRRFCTVEKYDNTWMDEFKYRVNGGK